jgi:hypothetical protein
MNFLLVYAGPEILLYILAGFVTIEILGDRSIPYKK